MATMTAQQVYAAARAAGASHSEAVTLTAIARGESGFSNTAHNPNPPDNSYGLWQINMLGSMGTARAKQWGLSNYNQLFDPRINAKAALSILRSQGWRAWSVYTSGAYKQYLSEATSAGKTVGDNWTSVARALPYIDQTPGAPPSGAGGVGTYIGGSTAGGAGGGSGFGGGGPADGGLPPNASPKQIEEYIRQHYPQAVGFLGIPEIRTLLINAARGEWTPEKLQGELQASKWWRSNGEAARQFYALKTTDPAQYKALIEQKKAELRPRFAELGVSDDPNVLNLLATGSLQYGWTEDQMRAQLAGLLRTRSGREGLQQGSAPDISADQLMQIARNEYFIPISRQDAERWAVDIFAGTKTEDTLRDYFARIASSRFPGLAEDGFTPGEYMAPIRNIIAETLELNPADVDFLDRRWSAVLQQEGSDGKMRPMTLAEATKWARSRPEYQVTKGALDEAAGLGEFVGQTFGRSA